jgi:hypothetical protein
MQACSCGCHGGDVRGGGGEGGGGGGSGARLVIELTQDV